VRDGLEVDRVRGFCAMLEWGLFSREPKNLGAQGIKRWDLKCIESEYRSYEHFGHKMSSYNNYEVITWTFVEIGPCNL
jgi:hypothetical protein